MDMKKLIKETVREMILDGEIGLKIVDVHFGEYRALEKHMLVIALNTEDHDGEDKYYRWGGVEAKRILHYGTRYGTL